MTISLVLNLVPVLATLFPDWSPLQLILAGAVVSCADSLFLAQRSDS